MCMSFPAPKPPGFEFYDLLVLHPEDIGSTSLVPIVGIITDDGIKKMQADIRGFSLRFEELRELTGSPLVLVPDQGTFMIVGFLGEAEEPDDARVCALLFASLVAICLDFSVDIVASTKVRQLRYSFA